MSAKETGTNVRVVLIDDEEPLRRAMSRLFSLHGIEVVGEAGDGQKGAALVEQLLPDVAIVDLRMPILDGAGAARLISTAVPNTRIIMSTAYEDPALMRECIEAGASAYVAKGGRPQELVDAILDLAHGKRSSAVNQP